MNMIIHHISVNTHTIWFMLRYGISFWQAVTVNTYVYTCGEACLLESWFSEQDAAQEPQEAQPPPKEAPVEDKATKQVAVFFFGIF